VNAERALELKDALIALFPQASGVQVLPEPDGAMIVIPGVRTTGNAEAGSEDVRVSVGNGDSPILRMLLSGHF